MRKSRKLKANLSDILKSKESKGITLVALVITIIILLILAGISISSLTNTGIFEKAKEAKNKSENAESEQNKKLDEFEKEIDKYLPDGNDETKKDDDDSWQDLSVTDKIKKLKKVNAKLAIFDKSVAGTKSDYNSKVRDDDMNVLEKSMTMERAECACGKVREIFNKAIEMNLVKDYTDVQVQTIVNDDGTEQKEEIIVAPIEEESVVLFDFYAYNFEQKPGEIVPVAFSMNYTISPNGKEWLDGGTPNFHKGSIENPDKDGGDFESVLTWVNTEYAKNGFVGMLAKTTKPGIENLTVTEIGQVVHRKISVLTKTDFVKSIKALNLDFSAYEGKCAHPIK